MTPGHPSPPHAVIAVRSAVAVLVACCLLVACTNSEPTTDATEADVAPHAATPATAGRTVSTDPAVPAETPATTAASPTTTERADPGPASTGTAPPTSGPYVALGSSYAAGTGTGPYIDIVCGRGDVSYPRLVAETTGLVLVDASCGGAHIDHVVNTRQVTGNVNHAPQIEQLSDDAALVTVTAGGNDMGYVGSLLQCHHGCPDHLLDDAASRGRRFAALTDELVAMVRLISERAPQARVLLVGYPRLFESPDVACAPLSADETRFFFDVGEHLQRSFVAAADRTGVTYVDPYLAFAGHGACAPMAERWVEGVEARPGGASWHPNAFGALVVADLVLERISPDGRSLDRHPPS